MGGGFLDFIIKPFAKLLDLVTFNAINTEKLINTSLGFALSFTKLGTPFQLAENITGIHVLPDKISKTKAGSQFADALGLGGTFIGKAISFQEDIALANILQDKMKGIVSQNKDKWMNEMRSMAFHSEEEVQQEMTRRVLEERDRELQKIILNRQVSEMIQSGSSFEVTRPEDLTEEVRKSLDQYKKSSAEKIRAERIQQEADNVSQQYKQDRQKFIEQYMKPGYTPAPMFRGYFEQMKKYYKL